LLCVKGLREEAGRAIVCARVERSFSSLDDLHRRAPELRKDELRKLAAVGALNFIETRPEESIFNSPVGQDGDLRQPNDNEARSAGIGLRANECRAFGAQEGIIKPDTCPDGRGDSPSSLRGSNRRDALWQVERVTRDPGELYEHLDETGRSPLQPMTLNERLNADLRGTGITIGRHPMAHQRAWLDTMKVIRAGDLKDLPNGKWIKVAGWVIVRQRPGTAKGFVFLSMEDETGIANVIVTPQLFEKYRLELVNYPFLLIEAVLQHQDNVISVKARRVEPLQVKIESPGSHDFH